MLFVRTMFVVMLMLDCLMCVYGVRLEDHSEYQNCIANPAGCTELYAARPPPGSVCEPVARSPSLSGWAGGVWGTQVPGQRGDYGHHPDDRGVVDEPESLVRFLPLSTLHVALNDGGY
jgi:hypothetical protein